MNKKLMDELAIVSDMLYREQVSVALPWVTTNLQVIREEMQSVTKEISDIKGIPFEDMLRGAIEIMRQLIYLTKREDALALADCLKYQILEYLKLGEQK